MKKFTRRFFLASGAAATAVVASQINRAKPLLAQTKQVNLYSSRHYNTDDQLYNSFTEQTGIKVNLIEGKDDELIERIKSEGANSPADILITVDAGRLWRAEEAGIFAEVNSPILTEKIPANLRHPNNLWFGFTKRARVIVYNKDTVDPTQLSTYENLADPQWKNRLVIRSSSNIYNQSLVAGLIEVHGANTVEQWCEGIVNNFARPPKGNDRAQIEAVAAGFADLGVVNTYYIPRYAKDNDPVQQAIFNQIGVFFPNQNDRGTHVNVSGGGLIKTAPNKDSAIAFLEYLASPTAQEFFAQGNNEYPAVPGTPIDPVVASLGTFKDGTTFKEDTVNVSAYGANNAQAVQIMDRAGWK